MSDNDRQIADYLAGKLAGKELDEFYESIVDGRVDLVEVEAAEKRIVDGLEAEQPSPHSLFAPIHGLAIAASVVLSVGTTAFFTTSGNLGEAETTLANANVTYLESYRSGSTNLPIVPTPNAGEWTTLITYPDFAGARFMQLHIERAIDASLPPSGVDQAGNWEVLLSQTMAVGTQDSLVVMIPPNLMQSGLHRLRIEGLVDESSEPVSVMRHQYVVE